YKHCFAGKHYNYKRHDHHHHQHHQRHHIHPQHREQYFFYDGGPLFMINAQNTLEIPTLARGVWDEILHISLFSNVSQQGKLLKFHSEYRGFIYSPSAFYEVLALIPKDLQTKSLHLTDK
ncbi:hypothetical protein DOY81_009153, partial [Sarcophaga bullata]